MIMLNGMPVKWRSNKQPKTSLSSAQSEIYALSEACKDVSKCSWVHEEMGRVLPRPMQVYVDNAAGISFQKVPVHRPSWVGSSTIEVTSSKS